MGTIKNFRTTADVTMNTRLKDGGIYIDWASLTDIRAWIYSDAQKALAGRVDVTIDQQDSTNAVLVYAGTKAQYPGVNRLIVQARYNGSLKTYDKPVFNFVPRTAEATGNVTIDEPETDVEIVVQDVSSSILDATILAALAAADRANEAAEEAEHMIDIHTGPAGKSPYIGENGNWWEWDTETDQYVDTGTKAKGDTGETPDISIGTVTTAQPGTPAAATMTGTPEAPVLNLTIPKGVAGDTPAFTVGEVTTGQPGTPVVVTITGTAAAPVLNIQIPQGLQGNTGSSVEYPYELVNNLTTDDATKGLSAAQGKVLKDELTQLEAEVDAVIGMETEVSPNILDLSTIVSGKYINKSTGGINSSSTNSVTDYIPVNQNGLYLNKAYSSGTIGGAVYSGTGGTSDYIRSCGAQYTYEEGDAYIRWTIRDTELASAMLVVGTSADLPDEYMPYGTITTPVLKDGIVTTPKIADNSVTSDKLADGIFTDELTDSTEKHYSWDLLDYSHLTPNTRIDTSGNEVTGGGENYRASRFIPLNGKKVFWIGMGSYGVTINGAAVYNANKEVIRVFRPALEENGKGYYDPIAEGEGAEYIRLTCTGSGTLYYVVYADANGNNPAAVQGGIVTNQIDYFREQIINHSNPGVVFGKEVIPELIPAFSQAGQDGLSKTFASISANNYAEIGASEYPNYLKTCHTLSVKAFLSSLGENDYVRFGIARNSSTGKAIRITAEGIRIERYDSGYVGNLSFSHGLTITDFIMCEVTFSWNGGKLRLVSRDGSFVQEWNNSQYSYTGNAQVNYGRGFVETTVSLTNVKLSQFSDRFRKPVWVIGDSYTSMATARWTWQMVNTFGIKGFLIDGYAGAPSENMEPEFERLLQFGTPKYLVWCLGMNDGASIWQTYAKKVEMICRDRGITLIYQTIPKSNDNKDEINLYIRNSGYRYIDFVSAVMPNGTWYADMDADGTHPTELGAKVLAGQVLVDFPEITSPVE